MQIENRVAPTVGEGAGVRAQNWSVLARAAATLWLERFRKHAEPASNLGTVIVSTRRL